jgi:hypothetical protein
MEGDHLEELSIDGSIILKWIFKSEMIGMEWIALAQDWERWWAFLNAVMIRMVL